MDNNILKFREFRDDFLNEDESPAEVKPQNVPMQNLLSKVNSTSSKVADAIRNKQQGQAGQAPGTAPSISKIGQIKAIDLLLATKAGAGFAKLLAADPDLITKTVGQTNASDSPDSHQSIWRALTRNMSNKKAFDKNVKSIKEVTADSNAVIEPDERKIPRSSEYDYESDLSNSFSAAKKFDNADEVWEGMEKFLKEAGYNLDTSKANIIAVRNKLSRKKGHQNHFTDWIIAMGPKKNKDIGIYEATTTPGPLYLPTPFRNWYNASGTKNSVNPAGVAILNPGTYSYKIGSHKGSYEALVQDGPVSVDRYEPVANPESAKYDTFSPGNTESGDFGINIHRGNSASKTSTIGPHSAGCLVFREAGDLKKTLNVLKDAGQRKVDVTLIEMDRLSRGTSSDLENILASAYKGR